MSFQSEPARGWRLEIDLDDMGRRRTVSLDFADRATLERQIEHQLSARRFHNHGRLLEFTNEAGEMLAVLATAYVAHAVRER